MHLLEKLERKIPSVIFQLLMSKAYGRATTFRTNFDFMNTVQKNFVFMVTKQEIFTFLFMR